jgi:hypothetical protein
MTMNQTELDYELIAPCGMNCGICKAHLRQNNPCHGCNYAEQNRPKTRERCRLRLCNKRKGKFCYSCAEFPCDRLRRLDNRYQTRYGISEIRNLKYLRDNGIERFMEEEHRRWVSDKGILCVHDKKYYKVNGPGSR